MPVDRTVDLAELAQHADLLVRVEPFDRGERTRGARVVEGPSQQNISQSVPSGETYEVAGSRLVMETDATDEAPALTSVALVATTPDRDVTMECQVPTRLYPRWRGACNQFLSTLTLTR